MAPTATHPPSRRLLARWWGDSPRLAPHELPLLLGAITLGLAVRLAYVLLTQHYHLAGDAPEYDFEGAMIAHGHFFWTLAPYQIAHASAWKAPGYPLWVGMWYTLLGHHPTAVRLVQVPFGAATICLTWVLARRLFGVRVALAAAFVVAVYPLAWQFEELLYPESFATPLMVALLIILFTRAPSARRAVLFGITLGVSTLVRPDSPFVLLALLVVWSISVGLRRGVVLTAVAAAVTVLVVAPWTVRNAIVLNGFVPVSLQDAALYGTFNPTSAHDPNYPYAWRPEPPNVVDLFDPRHPLSDVELRARLIHRGTQYIRAHPLSVPAAFFWNGITRLWDIRSRSKALVEVRFEGRSRFLTSAGLDIYSILLPLALVGLWRTRRRRAIALGVLAVAFGASIVFTTDAGTRYREPLEPLVVVLACAAVLWRPSADQPALTADGR